MGQRAELRETRRCFQKKYCQERREAGEVTDEDGGTEDRDLGNRSRSIEFGPEVCAEKSPGVGNLALAQWK